VNTCLHTCNSALQDSLVTHAEEIAPPVDAIFNSQEAEEAAVTLAARIACDASIAAALQSVCSADQLDERAHSSPAGLQAAYAELLKVLRSNAALESAPSAQTCESPLASVTQSLSRWPNARRCSAGPHVPTLRSQAGNAILRASFAASSSSHDQMPAGMAPAQQAPDPGDAILAVQLQHGHAARAGTATGHHSQAGDSSNDFAPEVNLTPSLQICHRRQTSSCAQLQTASTCFSGSASMPTTTSVPDARGSMLFSAPRASTAKRVRWTLAAAARAWRPWYLGTLQAAVIQCCAENFIINSFSTKLLCIVCRTFMGVLTRLKAFRRACSGSKQNSSRKRPLPLSVRHPFLDAHLNLQRLHTQPGDCAPGCARRRQLAYSQIGRHLQAPVHWATR
jgi:hypothetical protein